jgi:hypothetical protein
MMADSPEAAKPRGWIPLVIALIVLFLGLAAFTTYDVITKSYGWAAASGLGALACLYHAIRTWKASRLK